MLVPKRLQPGDELRVIAPSSSMAMATWSDDRWYQDQENRRIEPNDGHWVMNPGTASGTLIGGNLCTLNLLQGTEFMPDLAGELTINFGAQA